MGWFSDLGRKLSGAGAREREAEEEAEAQRRECIAKTIFEEHEARDHFDAQGVIERLEAEMPETYALDFFRAHCKAQIEPIIQAALEDGLISPDEEARIERLRTRYGGIQLDVETNRLLAAAKEQFFAWTVPLQPVDVPLMLKKDEWCAHAVRSTVYEERQRTVRVNYAGPSIRVPIMKGVYYRAGSIQAQRISESYHHSFGEGVLGATNKRLIWVSPQKSISIPLQKIVMFEPFIDGMKIIKDTGKPLLFIFAGPDQASMVRISRVVEELR